MNIKILRIVATAGMLSLLLNTKLFGETPDTLWTRTYGGLKHDMAYSCTRN